MNTKTTMLTLGMLVICVLSCSAARPSSVTTPTKVQDGEAPWFCHSIDCPVFKIKNTYADGVELREYAPIVWASTNVSDVKYGSAVTIGFGRLFSYISGANENGQHIEMTAPVRTRLIAGAGPFCEDTFTVSFMVPFSLQKAPPKPSSKDVFIHHEARQSVYVSSYGGYSPDSVLIAQTQALIKTLDNEQVDYDASVFYAAGYDAPFRILNRHNEIWIPASSVSKPL